MRCTRSRRRARSDRGPRINDTEVSIQRLTGRRASAAAFLLLLVATPGEAQERGPGPGVWDGVRYFGTAAATDAWAVARAPFEMSSGQAWGFAGVAAVGLALVPFDGRLWEHALEHRDDAGYRHVEQVAKWVEPFALQGRMNKYYAAGTVAGYIVDSAWDEPLLRHVFEELLISNVISAAGRKTIGRFIGRTRPSTGRGPYDFDFWDGSSFPSGHAANIATLATGHAIARIVIARREADHIEFGPIPAARSEVVPMGLLVRF